jgi:type II secretion system protein D
MNPPINKRVQFGVAAVLLFSGLICGLLFFVTPTRISAQSPPPRGAIRVTPDTPGSTPTPPPGASSGSSSDSSSKSTGPWIPSDPLPGSATNSDGTSGSTNDIQLSFQGANIEMIVQWLANTTGKAVVKHPQVQCQLTITSSKKTSPREAINIVYSALGLEGFTVIETTRSIYIVPEGKEPRMSPELLNGSQKDVPEGRRRLTRVFQLKYVQANDLKDKIRNALTDKATVDIDERANKIIITDYTDNIRVVGELIETLDSEKPQDLTVRVIPLKHMAAMDLAKELAPLYQKLNTKSPKDAVDVAADERSNSLIVFSSEASFNALERLITGLDTEDAQEKTTETFILKNADAQDVAKQIQDLTQDSSINARYYYVYSSSGNQSTKKTSVVADRRRNAVIVQAPPAQMEGIRRMIAELDEAIKDDSLAPKIYQLKYVSAVDIEDVLNELFLKKTQQPSYYDYIFGDGGSQPTADRDVGRLYGKVRITSEPYSNTIIVTSNSKESLSVVEDVLRQLDVPSDAGESTLRLGLKFAKSELVARNLNILFAKNGSPGLRGGGQQQQTGGNNTGGAQPPTTQQSSSYQPGFDLGQETREEGYYPWIGGTPDNPRNGDNRSTRPVSDLVGRVRVVPDQRGNALLISANVQYLPQVLKLVEALDAPADQVLIEARLVEVSSDFLDKLGVRWSPNGDKVFTADDFDNSLLANVTTKYQQGFGGNTMVNTPSSDVVAQALTSLRSGVLSATINMDFLVQFLRKTTDATVLAEPQINIRDNETGRLFVGQQVPIPDNNQAYQGTQNTTIKYKDVGVVLEVTPHINNSGDVELRIHTESSSIVPGVTVLGGAVFDTRAFRTDLRAKDGQTLILGGIIQKQMSDTLRKTPFLGSIPGLKWAFNKRDKTTREVELMVFLRPRVVRNPLEADQLMQDIINKAPLIKRSMDRDEEQQKKDEQKEEERHEKETKKK